MNRARLVLALVVGVFAVRAAAAMIIVPRWQGPDEPQHFLLAASSWRGLPSGSQLLVAPPPEIDAQISELEASIIRSMVREGWWAYYGAPTPAEPLPRRFDEGPNNVTDVPGAAGGGRVYFKVASEVVRAVGISGIEREYDVLRLMSAFWGLLTIVVAYVGTRAWVGGDIAGVVSAVLAFHPQFLLVSTTVSPDAFVNLCGAATWWQAGRAFNGSSVPFSLAGLWGSALAAAITRRMGAPLVVLAVAATLVVIRRHGRGQVRALTAVLVVVSVAALGFVFFWPDEFARVTASLVSRQGLVAAGRPLPDLASFSWMLWQSLWLFGGWLRFAAPNWLMIAISTWSTVALCGIVLLLVSRGRHDKTVVWSAVVAVAMQGLAIFVIYWWVVAAGAQGRYLFPVVVPLITLLVLGTIASARALTGQTALWAPVALMVAFDGLAWTTVLIPAYAR